MKRSFLASVLIALSAAALCAQQPSQQDSYQGTSKPPADEAIVSSDDGQSAAQPAKPAPGKPITAEPAQPAPAADQSADQSTDQSQAQQQAPQPNSVDPNVNSPGAGADAGTSAVAPAPALATRALPADPDGDIVHPEPLRPGELGEGTAIRVKLLDRLSTANSERGQPFHSQVATDVLQGGQVIIPAGTEIDGTVVEVSSGHAGGTGSMRLRPEFVVMADGTRYRIFAQVTGTPGSKTHVIGEGVVKPDSRWKRNSIEYGGAVGAGVVTGAVMAGPVGALTGGIIGAGAITAHLLISHPQATLEPGTTMMLELTGPLEMTPANPTGN